VSDGAVKAERVNVARPDPAIGHLVKAVAAGAKVGQWSGGAVPFAPE